MRLFYIVLISIFTLSSFGQNNTAYQDSLLKAMEVADSDSTAFMLRIRLANSYQESNPEEELKVLLQALQIANKTKLNRLKARALYRIAQNHFRQGDIEGSLEQHKLALNSMEVKDDPELYIEINNGLTSAYRKKGFFSKAIEASFESIKLCDKYNYELGKTSAYNNIGIIYSAQNRFDKALIYFQKVRDYFDQIGDQSQVARMSANMAIIYKNLRNYDESKRLFHETLNFFLEQKNERALYTIYQNVGVLFAFSNNLDSALYYYSAAYEIAKKFNLSYPIAESGIALASVQLKLDQLKEAVIIHKEVETVMDENDFRPILPEFLMQKGTIENMKGNYQEALRLFIRGYDIRDSIREETHTSAFSELQSNYEAEQKEIQIEQLQKEKELETAKVSEQQAIIDKQNTQRIAFIGGIGVLLLFGAYMLFNIRQKRKANELLKLQKEEIQDKNKEITDSITYAKRIQDAVLPSDDLIRSQLPDSFVFYLPKDIVSGDFYWVEPVPNAVLFATVDCTGHGVPGGFMSMLGHNALYKAVRESSIDKPSKVLDYLHQSVVDSLQNNNNEVRDGMDVAICALVEKEGGKKELEFAGAMNPIYIVSNGELTEMKGDKMAIGSGYKNKPFTNHIIDLNKGDMVYIFSDGYPDQFGGENGKKYKYANFKKLLLSVCEEPITTQREKLAKEFYNWKGQHEQVDDILVMGVRI